MTYKELFVLLSSKNDAWKTMLASGTSLPRVLDLAAIELFLHNDTRSDFADIIRANLNSLAKNGYLAISDHGPRGHI